MLKRLFVTSLVLSLTSLPLYAATDKKSAHDGEIIAMVIALDNNEITAAKKAVDTTNNSAVRDFANKIVEDHSKNLADMQSMGQKLGVTDASDSHAEEIQKQGDAEMKKLSSLNDGEFDKAYMDAQVKDHKDALKMVSKMISKATSPELKDLLEKTKETIAHHLEDAKKVDADLSKAT